jgi:hypothetical protein
MSRILASAIIGALLFAGAVLSATEDKQKKDPPQEMRGVVKKVETQDPEAIFVTITVKEMQPTDKEDVLQEVDRDHRFKLAGSARVIGLDGKPQEKGARSLKEGDRVRVEYRKDTALEVKRMPPR